MKTLKKYRVQLFEVWMQEYEVFAPNKDKAKEEVRSGNVEACGNPDFSHTLDSAHADIIFELILDEAGIPILNSDLVLSKAGDSFIDATLARGKKVGIYSDLTILPWKLNSDLPPFYGSEENPLMMIIYDYIALGKWVLPYDDETDTIPSSYIVRKENNASGN